MTWLWSSKRTVSCFFKTWLLAEDDASRIAWCIFRLAWVLNKWSVNAMYRKILGDNWNDPFSKRKGRLFFNQQVRCRQSLLRPIREKVPPLHMHARVLLESGFWSFVVVYVKGLLSHTTNKKKTKKQKKLNTSEFWCFVVVYVKGLLSHITNKKLNTFVE